MLSQAIAYKLRINAHFPYGYEKFTDNHQPLAYARRIANYYLKTATQIVLFLLATSYGVRNGTYTFKLIHGSRN